MKKKIFPIDRRIILEDSEQLSSDIVCRASNNRLNKVIAFAKLLAVVVVLVVTATVSFGKVVNLTVKQRQNFVRHLFPLPQEIELKSKAFVFNPYEFTVELDGKMSKLSKEFIKQFQQTWTKCYKTKLAVGSAGEKVTIYIGTTKNFKPFKRAENQHIIDFVKLAKVKNAEQGYAISCAAAGERLNIYIAANNAAGIYNALTTFEQLLSVNSSQNDIIIPQMTLLDWPDIKSRGEWGSKLYKTPKRLVKYSKMKLNSYWDPYLYGRVSKTGKIRYELKKELIDLGASLNVHIVPILTHLDCMMRPNYMVYENFRELMGVEGKEKFKNHRPWCFSQPKSQVVLDGILEAVARDVGSENLWMWPSEHGYACSCPKCKGDKHLQNVREFKHIMHAYKKAKAIRPNFKMTLITTQGTRKYNVELLKYLPKDVGLDIYDGSLTYQTMTDKPILNSFAPLMKAMRAEGRSIGVVPLFAASHLPANMFFPFNSPLLSKVRMEEFKTQGIERVIGFLPPNIFVQKICGQSMAEFAWNTDGRTTKEFLISLAVRQGMNDPELFAEVILLLEPSELMLSKSIRADKLRYPLSRMINILMGNKPKWGNYHDILRGFKDNGQLQITKALADCNKAYKLAKKQGNQELITGTRLIKQWINILELYSQYLADKSKGDEIRRQVRRLFEALPEIWEDWIVTQPLSKQRLEERRNAFYKIIENTMKTIEAGKAQDADVVKTIAKQVSKKVKISTIKLGDKIFEAEDAAKLVGVESKHFQENFSGSGYADYVDAKGAFIEWEVNIVQPGKYNISFVYALASDDRPLKVTVNGITVKDKLSFSRTDSWSTWGESISISVKLGNGVNKIRLTTIGASGGNIDYMKLTPAERVSNSSTATSKIPMIIDTDMMTDCDDAGALAVAHALDHKGEIELVGVIVSTHDYNQKHCNVVSAINTYYGKPNIPIGLVDAKINPYKDWNIVRTAKCPFSKEIYDKFPHDGISNRDREDSTIVYRKLLHDAADHSVVIVVTGHLNAVANLLKSTSDSIDARNGIELVAAKIRKIVTVGGGNILKLPRQRNMNFTGHRGVDAVDVATKYWINNWPDAAEIVVVPDNIGGNIITGPIYKDTNTPMEIAYIKSYNGIKGRPSWDQMGVIAGTRGGLHNGVIYWKIRSKGHLDISMTGEACAHWEDAPNKNQSFLIDESGISNRDLTIILNKLMDPRWVK